LQATLEAQFIEGDRLQTVIKKNLMSLSGAMEKSK